MVDKAKGDGNGTKRPGPTAEEMAAAQKPPTLQPQGPGRTPIGYTLTQDCLQGTINIMKRLPWEDVYKIVPQLVGAQPIYHEPATEEPTAND